MAKNHAGRVFRQPSTGQDRTMSPNIEASPRPGDEQSFLDVHRKVAGPWQDRRWSLSGRRCWDARDASPVGNILPDDEQNCLEVNLIERGPVPGRTVAGP